MTHHDKRDAIAALGRALKDLGWTLLGYKEDQSDSMTDYYDPARWDGIATKGDFLCCVGVSDWQANDKSGKDEIRCGHEPIGERRAAEEEEARRLEEQERQHEIEENRRRAQEAQIQKLVQQSEAWDRANRIRAFIDAFENAATAKHRQLDAGCDLAKWLAWARQVAEKSDPIWQYEAAHPSPEAL